jgi:hypothetical protein
MVILQNYQIFLELTSNMIYSVALDVGLKCPCKIHLNTQCPHPPFPCLIGLSEIILTIIFSVFCVSSYYKEKCLPYIQYEKA